MLVVEVVVEDGDSDCIESYTKDLGRFSCSSS